MCDDGNQVDNDGCNNDCTVTGSWECSLAVDFSSLDTESFAGSSAMWEKDVYSGIQRANSVMPTFALFDANAFGQEYTFSMRVIQNTYEGNGGGTPPNAHGDDDFIGFALGFNPGDTLTVPGYLPNYFLIDWKAREQSHQRAAKPGLFLSHVHKNPTNTGQVTSDFFHKTKTDSAVNILRQATGTHINTAPAASVEPCGLYGNTGWKNNVLYTFRVNYSSSRLKIEVQEDAGPWQVAFDEVPANFGAVFPGGFPAGELAFYGLSQPNVEYSLIHPLSSICTPICGDSIRIGDETCDSEPACNANTCRWKVGLTSPAEASVTYDPRLPVSGTGDVGATIRLKATPPTGPAFWLNEVVVAPDGTWSVTPTADWPVGVIAIQANSVDLRGGTSVASGTFERVAHFVTITSPAPPNTLFGGPAFSNSVVVSGLGVPSETVNIGLDGVSAASTTVLADGTWTATIAVTEGPRAIVATSTNSQNVSAEDNVAILVDISTFVSITTPANNSTSSAPITAISGAGEPGAMVVVTVGALSETATVGIDGKWSVTAPGGPLKDGSFTATAVITDALSNTATATTVFDMPNIPPVVPAEEVWVAVGTTSVPVALTSNEPVTVTIVSQPTGATATVVGSIVTVVPADPAAPGTYAVSLKACDTVVGNSACTNTTATVIYNDLPTVNGGTDIFALGSQATLPLVTSPGAIGTIDTVTIAAATNGVCTIVGTNVVFAPSAGATAGQTGVCTVKVCEEKPTNHCSEEDFSFEIKAAFAPKNDQVSTTEDVYVDIDIADLLSNDGSVIPTSFGLIGTRNPDGTITTPEGGTLVENGAGGGLIYTPKAGHIGYDSFEYEVCSLFDATDCDDVLVTIIVNAKPLADPSTTWVAVGTPSVPVDLDTIYTGTPIGAVTVGAVGPLDGTTPPGTVTVTGGIVTFVPTNPADFGTYTVDVTVCDTSTPIACVDTTLTIVYNDAPVINGGNDPVIVTPGGFTSQPIAATPGELGTIATSTIVPAGTSTNGACSIVGTSVRFDANAAAPSGTTGTCTVRVCEEKPADLCTDKVFTFDILNAFTPADDAIVGAQGQTTDVPVGALLGNDGNVTASTFALVGTVTGGTVSITSGVVSFVSDATATAGSFQYEICSGIDVSICETVDVTVDIAAKPTPNPTSGWTLPETPVTIDSPFTTPTDNTPVGPFTGGTPTVDGDGNIVVTPDPGFIGVITIDVTGCTKTVPTVCETSTITVTVNDMPTLDDARRTVAPGQTRSVAPDADAGTVGAIAINTLTVLPATATTEGTCIILAGKVQYTADADAIAGVEDTCIVQICEEKPAGACATANFVFEIGAAFNPAADTITTTEEVPVDIKIGDLTGNDGSITDGSFVLVGTPDGEGVITTGNGGTLVPNDDGDGYIYTPAEGFTGDDTFDYTVCSFFDATECETVTVTVTVNDAPAVTPYTEWTVTGTPSVDVDLTENYVGAPIGTVTVGTIGPEDDGGLAPGTVTVLDGVITFVPNDPSLPGIYDVVIDICDTATPIACTETTVTIIYNDPPTAGTPLVKVPGPGAINVPFVKIIRGTTVGEVDGGWDTSSIAVSNDPAGPFSDDADLVDATCAIVDGVLVYTATDAAFPACFVQVCELNPGPAGTDTTGRACTVINLTPVQGVEADVVITGPANNSETKDSTPTVTGTGEPNTTVTIFVDGTEVGTVPVDEDGNWTWTPEEGLDEGPRTITAKGENGSEDVVTVTILKDETVDPVDPVDPVEPTDDELMITGGQFFGCTSASGSAPVGVIVLFGLGLVALARRRDEDAA